MSNNTPNDIFVNPEFVHQFRRIARKVDRVRGPSVRATSTGISILPPTSADEGMGDADHGFPAKITGTSGGGYTWTEQNALSDGTFEDTVGGRTDSDNGIAYEANGSTSVASGTYVWLFARTDATNSEISYTFTVGGTSSGSPILYGTLSSSWDGTSGTVTLTPCNSAADATATGAPDVTCFIYGTYGSPSGSIPTAGVIPASFISNTGKPYAYFMVYTDTGTPSNSRGQLIAPPDEAKGGTQYQVRQRDGSGHEVFDYVRAT